jgi:hypothetical protein
MKCQNPSLHPNEMSELPTAPEWNGMLLVTSDGNATTPHLLGRKRDAPRSIGMKCQGPSLRPNEMSELLLAPERNGMLLIASEGQPHPPHRPGRKLGAPQSIGMKFRQPSLGPNGLSELLTAPEWEGMLLMASEGNVTTLTRPARNGTPHRASE